MSITNEEKKQTVGFVKAGKPDRCKRYNKSEVKEIDEYRKTNTRTIRNRIRK